MDRGGAALYVASIVATGWVYAAATAVLAQVLAHHRTVWAASLAVAGLTLVTRGVADALGRTAEAPADRPTDEGGSEI